MNKKTILMSTGLTILLITYFFLIRLEDPILSLHQGNLKFLDIQNLLILGPWIILIMLVKYGFALKKWKQIFILSAFIYTIGYCLFLNARQMRNYTTAPSWHEYGQTGLQETVDFLADNINPDTKLMIRKDIGYHLNYNYHYNQIQWFYPVFRGTEEEIVQNFTEVMKDHDISYVTLDPTMNIPKSQKIIEPFFELDQSYGDFNIYKRKQSKSEHIKTSLP